MRERDAATGQGADGGERVEKVPPEIAAEAAVWIARLHGPERSPQMERELREWQARSPVHRHAFERCTETWMAVSGLSLSSYASAVAASRQQRRAAWHRPVGFGLATAAMAGIVAATFLPRLAGETYDTGVGEQRLVVLPDGTRMSLNTATRVRVAMDATKRIVDLNHGEALFEVAKDVGRPFHVQAAGADVRATGTAFVVRVSDSATPRASLDVTLVEGQVVVTPVAKVESTQPPPIVMVPGERIRLNKAGDANSAQSSMSTQVAPALQREHPRMDRVLAWKRGEAIFDNLSVNDAVLEMNRYSATPIVLSGAVNGTALRVSGVFKTGHSTRFAQAVASLHGLVVRELSDRIELSAK